MQPTTALALILLAGPVLGTLGGLVFHPSRAFLCVGFAFTGGAMIAVSLLQLIPQALELVGGSASRIGLGFLLGFALMGWVDRYLPHFHWLTQRKDDEGFSRSLGTILAGVGLHNLPEGFAVGASLHFNGPVAWTVALAIALHDVPETLIPVAATKAATGRWTQALTAGILTSVPSFIGFALGAWGLSGVGPHFLGFLSAMTAGIMVYLSVDELLPASWEYKRMHLTHIGLVSGVTSILLLGSVTR